MGLVKNTAKEMADHDEGLSVNTDSTLQESIDITNKKWPEIKSIVDDMDLEELDTFINDTKSLNLSKKGCINIRVTPREYAVLKFKSGLMDSTITNVLSMVYTDD